MCECVSRLAYSSDGGGGAIWQKLYDGYCTSCRAESTWNRNAGGSRFWSSVCVCDVVFSYLHVCVCACAPNCIDYTRRRKRIRFEAHLNNRLLYDAHPNVFICVGALTSLAGGGVIIATLCTHTHRHRKNCILCNHHRTFIGDHLVLA